MTRRMVFLLAFALAALGAVAVAHAALPNGAPRMGTTSSIKRPAFHGYYDGNEVTYLNTDVSDKTEASAMHINYAPGLRSVPLASAPEIYLVEGKAASGQRAVFGSEPGEATYSPIWKETLLSWKPGATPALIKSDTQVNQLEKKGELTERATSIRLNCPIIEVAKHS